MALSSTRGFTMIELVMVIVILGVLATVAVPKFFSISDTAKIKTALGELAILKGAILGNPDSRVDGVLVDRGFQGHIGRSPTTLTELTTQGVIPEFNKFTQTGWAGPYVTDETLTDPWERTYEITADSNLKSLGPDAGDNGDDIILPLY